MDPRLSLKTDVAMSIVAELNAGGPFNDVCIEVELGAQIHLGEDYGLDRSGIVPGVLVVIHSYDDVDPPPPRRFRDIQVWRFFIGQYRDHVEHCSNPLHFGLRFLPPNHAQGLDTRLELKRR
ncbi:MAG: hypothetical protein AABY18_01215 [Candidatus Thermoplasmatota archaeon]